MYEDCYPALRLQIIIDDLNSGFGEMATAERNNITRYQARKINEQLRKNSMGKGKEGQPLPGLR
jgi:hypothetical protein